jgi:RNA polymerase sigma factor for flagellar operon FliA
MQDDTSQLETQVDASAQAWRRFAGGDIAARRELVMSNLALVRSIAWEIYQKASLGYVEIRDLIQLGVVGLLESISRFDPASGTSFAGFASKRIRGSILNALEKQSEYHAQSAFRRRVRRERLESLSKFGEDADKSSDVFMQMVETALGLAVGYLLEDTAMYVDENRNAGESFYPSAGELAIVSESLRALVSKLAEPDRQVIELHYLGAVQFSDIADILGVTKGRVSQVHARALKALRKLQSGKAGFNIEV